MRMSAAIIDRKRGVFLALRPIHRLQEKMIESEFFKPFRRRIRLRIDEFQFIAAHLQQSVFALRTDADPVEPLGRCDRSIRFNGDIETARMERADKRRIKLQQGFAACADDKRAA